ncbi:MAG: LolA family protein [Streptosporangiaceae bacterium]
MVRKLGVRARWAVPAGVVAAVGIVIAASAVASAESAPSLPGRSAAQLLADMAGANARPLGPLTATIQQTSDFGLPALPAAATQQGGPAAALASGQSVSIWYLDAQHIRLAVPVQSGESDLRLDGRTLWLWNSKTQTATHVVLPAHFSGPNFPGNGSVAGASPSARSAAGPAGLPDSPLAAARQLLAAIGPSTAVTVQRNVYVAGRAAYQLSVVPRTSGSLVGQILIAIDASTHIPLRLQVFARGVSSPAFQIGFTALTFGRPAMSNFTFTPPPGATVKQETVPSRLPAGLGKLSLGRLAMHKLAIGRLGLGKLSAAKLRQLQLCGAKLSKPTRACAQLRISVMNPAQAKGLPYGWTGPAPFPAGKRLPKQVIRRIEASFARSLPKNMPKAQRAKIIKAFDQQFSKGFIVPPGSAVAIKSGGTANNGGGFFNVHTPAAAVGFPLAGAFPAGLTGGARPTIIGKDWLTVVATQPNPAVAAAVKQLLSAHPGAKAPTVFQQQSSSGTSAYSSTLRVSAMPAGPDLAVLHALLLATRPVHGSWGSGRLLTTSLFSVLITSNGRVLAGAVTPAVLYRDAAVHAG